MSAETKALLEATQELLRWTKVSAIPTVRGSLDQVLTTTSMRRSYEMFDGTATFRQVASATGASQGSLSNWSKRWRELGLAFEDDHGRLHHLVSLSSLGLPIDVDHNTSGRG